MTSKEPTRAQLSSRLSYQQHTPAFLLKLQNRISGRPSGSYGSDDEDEPQYVGDDDYRGGGRGRGGAYEDEEWEYDGSGRPPIPKRPRGEPDRDERPPIPERPDDDPGSADEDDDDEKPQVVVLKQGKHLTEREAENVRRAERGLPPLPDEREKSSGEKAGDGQPRSSKEGAMQKPSKPPPSLSFSSSGAKASSTKGKRKAIVIEDDEADEPSSKRGGKKDGEGKSGNKAKKKKTKKTDKALLSFGADA
ncbi:hypothetical protein AX16_010153 [Volvariella volvacea WC 439]|nr:hypothetical protein AX16_010153 [Volvariella volvacea WC 439]